MDDGKESFMYVHDSNGRTSARSRIRALGCPIQIDFPHATDVASVFLHKECNFALRLTPEGTTLCRPTDAIADRSLYVGVRHVPPEFMRAVQSGTRFPIPLLIRYNTLWVRMPTVAVMPRGNATPAALVRALQIAVPLWSARDIALHMTITASESNISVQLHGIVPQQSVLFSCAMQGAGALTTECRGTILELASHNEFVVATVRCHDHGGVVISRLDEMSFTSIDKRKRE